MGYALFGLAVVLLGFPLGVATLLLDDFVVPLMAVRNVPVGEAWRICRDEVLSGHIGGLVLFYVLRFVLAIGIAIAGFVLSCITCCISRISVSGHRAGATRLRLLARLLALLHGAARSTNLPRPGTVMGRIRPMAVSEVMKGNRATPSAISIEASETDGRDPIVFVVISPRKRG
jgi:hypothetical protein